MGRTKVRDLPSLRNYPGALFFVYKGLMMKSALQFLRTTALWLLLLPVATGFTGITLNQAVLIANHDKFPVMINEKIASHQSEDGTPLVDKYGMLDNEHCVMTSETHLNILADIFDMKDSYVSIGDILIDVGSNTWNFFLFGWIFVAVNKLRKEQP